jgi:subtilisin family serine protease
VLKYYSKVLLCFFLLFAVHRASAQGNETHDGHPVKGQQVLFRLSSSAPALLQHLGQLSDADDVRPLSRNLNLYVLHSKSVHVDALLNVLKNEPGVLYIEPDYIVKAVGVIPNDTSFSQQWALLNTTNPGADISATSAWAVSTGGTATVAGVVDTGIDYTHPDLSANVWAAPAIFTVNLSWGSLTCPAGSHGYNSIMRSCDPRDDHGHGTHVSGTIGAVGNNALGVAGVNWTARIMALKFLDSTGSGSTSDAVDAIEFALQTKTIFGAAANVRVLSNSWGGDGFSQSLLDEINRANTADTLFVVAAGNSTNNNDVTPTYPAAFTAPNIVTVAATTITDGLASFSNFGRTTVHLGAPGVGILSTLPNASYGSLSGTSMATPHVSGAALLLLSACTLNTAALKNAILANVDPVASLNGITVTGGRLNVNKAIRSCAAAQSATGTASFLKIDTTTSGTWKSVYGADGYNIINDTANYPAYVTATPSGNASYIWAPSTTDTRGLQKAASTTDRIAACWYTPGAFSIDLRFNDASTHQVAVYLVDWDNYGPRSERVDILDANNVLLDSRTVSGFGSGQYLVWNLGGHVTVRITNLNGNANAVISGLLFGAGGTITAPPPTGTAAFVKTDASTSGTWKGIYGADGYNVINDTANYPAYVTATPSGNASYIWAPSTTDTRGLQKASSTTDRMAACWYSPGAFSIDLQFHDTSTHQVALYLVDWDSNGARSERVDILDANNVLLDSRSVSSFGNGQYLVWNLSGHVTVRMTNLNGSVNAVVSGLLFGTGGTVAQPTGTASFLKTDTTTSGTWKSVYGADGYNIINDTANYPAYLTATPSGNASYIWAPSTTDTRGLQKAASTTDRIAACWYTFGVLNIDLQFHDTSTHQVALYLVDWDGYGPRSERVDILDANNVLLDSRTVSGFGTGQYLVWSLSGHVNARITNLNPNANAVMSGILFR